MKRASKTHTQGDTGYKFLKMTKRWRKQLFHNIFIFDSMNMKYEYFPLNGYEVTTSPLYF